MFYFADIGASTKTAKLYTFDNEEMPKLVGPFSKLNIFVGQNNAGKSNFLRQIFCTEKMVGSISLTSTHKQILTHKPTETELRDNKSRRNMGFEGLLQHIFVEAQYNHTSDVRLECFYEDTWHEYEAPEYTTYLTITRNNFPKNAMRMRHYIPMIRGMRPFNRDLETNVYLDRTKEDYFDQNTKDILTGLGMYNDILNRDNGAPGERAKIKAYEQWLSHHFFEGRTVEITSNVNAKMVYLMIDDTEHVVYNWGDSMQNLLILTYWPFIYRQGHFFIEEPDITFHPAMQRKLLDAYRSKELSKCQFFMTTHSNHLIDVASLDEQVAVFTFQKTQDNQTTIRRVGPDDREPLLLLGAQASSVMLSNCTIWVEGITDRMTLQHFLQLCFEHHDCPNTYKEDLHYTFLPYGGGNITQWSFLDEEGINAEYVCSIAFLVADADGHIKENGQWRKEEGDPDKKTQRLNTLEQFFGDRVHILHVREFENLHTQSCIEAFVSTRPLAAKTISKNKPFRFDEDEVDEHAWQSKYMGTLIHEQLDALGFSQESVNVFAENRKGTLKSNYKKQLATFSHTHYENFEDLSEPAQALTQAIFDFIVEMNTSE